MSKKNLIVNAAVCDMRNLQEEVLEQYDKVMINSGMILISDEGKRMMAKYGVELNCSGVVQTEETGSVSSHNGMYVIRTNDEAPIEKGVLLVNGTLKIEPGTEKVLDTFLKIIVNGLVVCPQSLAGYLLKFQINGKTETYPDDAILLKRTFFADRVFGLRAKEANYFVGKKVILMDSEIDGKMLAEKKVKFLTPKVIMWESFLEDCISLFEDNTEIEVVPSKCKYLEDDIFLDESVIQKYGTSLYVNGDVKIDKNSKSALEQITYLKIAGTVLAEKEMEALILQKEIQYEEMETYQGKLVEGVSTFSVTKESLSDSGEKITLLHCGMVTIEEDVTKEQLKNQVLLIGCGVVKCSEVQKNQVEACGKNIGKIITEEEKTERENMQCINTSNYTF